MPSIGKAIAEGKQNGPYWSPLFRGFELRMARLRARNGPCCGIFQRSRLEFLPRQATDFRRVGATSEEGWGMVPISIDTVQHPFPSLAKRLILDEVLA